MSKVIDLSNYTFSGEEVGWFVKSKDLKRVGVQSASKVAERIPTLGRGRNPSERIADQAIDRNNLTKAESRLQVDGFDKFRGGQADKTSCFGAN
jgi:hypothetical protein